MPKKERIIPNKAKKMPQPAKITKNRATKKRPKKVKRIKNKAKKMQKET